MELDEKADNELNEYLLGPQLSFVKVKIEKIYFKEAISQEFRERPMPNNIRKHRNIAIVLMFV